MDPSFQRKNVLFTAWDYAIMISALLVSTIIGLSHALKFSTKGFKLGKASTREYFMASGNLGLIPVTLSLVASRISPMTTLGFPVEVYSHGISIWFFVIGEFLGCVFAAFFCIPIFFPLKFNSIYEVLERRFESKAVRLVCVLLYIVKIVMYLGFVLYGPAVALNSVTPLSIDASILTCGILCCLYTAFGGIRGVVWTDVFQTCVILGGQVAILVLGVMYVGGVSTVWERSQAAGRIKLPETRFDFFSRHSFWNIILAPTVEWTIQMGAAQMAIQRVMALGSMRKAIVSLTLTGFLVVVITTLSMACGLVVTSNFAGCDPCLKGEISDENEYLPYLALTLFSRYPGLTGLFVAGIFSASLSSISSGINAVANVVWDDLLCEFQFFRQMSEMSSSCVARISALVLGFIPIAIAFLAKDLGDNIQKMGTVFVAITTGAMNAMFISCYYIKCVNSKGLLSGCFVSVLIIGWWVIAGTVHPPPVTTLDKFASSNCSSWNLNEFPNNHQMNPWTSMYGPNNLTTNYCKKAKPKDNIDWSVFPYYLYSMGYLWYQLMGTFIAVVFSVIFSFFFRLYCGNDAYNVEYMFTWSKFIAAFKKSPNQANEETESDKSREHIPLTSIHCKNGSIVL